MSDLLHIYAKGNPVEIVLGAAARQPHIVAQIYPVGRLCYLEEFDEVCERVDETPRTVFYHTLKEADWEIHPDEAAATFEFRDGDQKVLATYQLQHLEKIVTPEQELQNDIDWDLVHRFAKTHGLDLTSINEKCCARLLELELERQQAIDYPPVSKKGLNPVRAGPAFQPSISL